MPSAFGCNSSFIFINLKSSVFNSRFVLLAGAVNYAIFHEPEKHQFFAGLKEWACILISLYIFWPTFFSSSLVLIALIIWIKWSWSLSLSSFWNPLFLCVSCEISPLLFWYSTLEFLHGIIVGFLHVIFMGILHIGGFLHASGFLRQLH